MPTTTTSDANTLLLQLYRLSHELPIDQFQNAALQLIKQVLPFDASMWGSATTSARGLDIHLIHLHQKSPEMLSAYEPLKHLDTAGISMFDKHQATSGFHAESWFTKPCQRELLAMLQKFEQKNYFITSQHNPNTRIAEWITLFRADADAHCTAEEVRLLAQLSPHVLQAQAFNRVTHLNQLGIHAAGQHGTAIADLLGVLYHADPVFREVMAREWGNGKRHKLPAPVLHHFSKGQSHFIGDTTVMSHHTEHDLLFLKVRARCRADSLTPREHTVASLVAKGCTYKEIARLLNRAPATVRNHIQAIHEKLGVNHVAGLIEELRLTR